MPRVRRSHIGRRTRNANRIYNFRNRETEEDHSQRLDSNRIRNSQARNNTSEEPIASTSRARQQNIRTNVGITYERLAFRYDATVDYAGDKSVDFGTMRIICQYCNALKFQLEPQGLCCANGKVKLPQLTTPPEPLNSLLSGQGSLSKHFMQNIQSYNSVFQMTSFGANIIEERGFNPTFKVQIFLFFDSHHRLYIRVGKILIVKKKN